MANESVSERGAITQPAQTDVLIQIEEHLVTSLLNEEQPLSYFPVMTWLSSIRTNQRSASTLQITQTRACENAAGGFLLTCSTMFDSLSCRSRY